MNIDLFNAYRAEPPGPKKRKLLEQLIKENERLVGKFVDRFMRHTKIVAPREDLYQAGLMGLMKALEKLDPEKGKLSTYAAHWIKQYLQNEIRHHTDIYRPAYTGMPWRAVEANARAYAKNGIPATKEEMSEALGEEVTDEDIEDWRQEAPIYDRYAVAADTLLGNDDYQPDSMFDKAMCAENIFEAIEQLEGEERTLVTLLAEGNKSINIMHKMKITKDRFHEMKAAALKHMRQLLQ